MKNLITISFLGIFFLFSCQKKTVDEDLANHPVLWSKYLPLYEADGIYSLPLVDESDNIYLILPMDTYYNETESTLIVSFDKYGHTRWEKTFEGRHRGKMSFGDNKLYFFVSLSPEKDNQSILYSIDKVKGEVVLKKELDIYLRDDIQFYYTQNRLYISRKNKLYAYDLQGIEQWVLSTESDITAAVKDSAFFVILDKQKIRMYKEGEYLWEWQAEDQSALFDVELGKDNSLYVRGDGVMNILSFDGILIKHYPFDMDPSYSYRVNGNCILVGGKTISKLDEKGLLLWEREVLKNVFVNNELSEFTIASNGNIYVGHSLGLTALSKNGEQLWQLGYKQDIVQLMQPILMNNGDLICFSPENLSIQCIKGDGSPPE